jgi:hypothetical protein
MDVNIVTPSDSGPAPTTHADLASGFAAELAAERNPPKADPAPVEADDAEPEVPVDAVDAPLEAAAEQPTESDAVEADDTATAEADDAAETPSESSQIVAPSGMSDADKALYAKLPTEMKAWVAKQEAARTADYTRKTQQVAEQKKAFDNGVLNVTQRLQALDAELAKFTDNVVPPPDPALRDTDPLSYDEQLGKHLHSVHLRELAGKEREKVQRETDQTLAAMRDQFHRERSTQLRELAPELFGAKGQEIGKQIQEYATTNGYSVEQLKAASATDIMTLWKAQKYDAIEAAKKSVKTVPPPAPKVSKPGPAKTVGRPSNLANAIQNFDRNPSRDALAAAYAAEIASERR